jgi:mannosylglycoprotein endo-beta-mannosidase
LPTITDLHSGWKLHKADDALPSGETISTRNYVPIDWTDAVVPGTVLTSLLQDRSWLADNIPEEILSLPQNREQFDPFWHLNNKQIPDLGDRTGRGERFKKGRGRDFYTFWYRTEFTLDASQRHDERLWLHFRGINYAATFFLNGHKLENPSPRGMFLRRAFDVTDQVIRAGTNALAVRVEPLDWPGICTGVNGADGEIGRNVGMQYLSGWDWVPPIADRNTGIWDRVSLQTTGPVRLRHPHIITHVPGVRTPDTPQDPVFLTVTVELENSTDRPQRGLLRGEIESVAFEQEVRLLPNETRIVHFSPDHFPQLKFADPRLWWPSGYGSQDLYPLHLSFATDDGHLSDTDHLRFGIREIRSDIPPGMGRVFYVNGRRIFIRGGNWVGTDALLRLSAERYRDEVRLHREMGLNMIRIWGGAIAERPEFYDACDEFGILVMQDFWITGDCNGAWNDASKRPQPERRHYPDDHDLFLACARDTIRMLRNHASLCFWCGGNEITPPADIDAALARYIGHPDDPEVLDPAHVYIPASADADYVDFDGDGLYGHGPYGYQEPEHYCGLAHGFTTEIGTSSLPQAESLRAMIAAEDLFPDGRPGWDTETWRYHNQQNPDIYGFAIEQYGPSRDLDDFCLKAQLANYKSYQGIFEAWNTRMWDNCSGLLIWKSQNCWPNMRSQIYDWYLEPTGGYFITRRACAPIHIQLDQATWRVGICNTTCRHEKNLTATAVFYDLDGTPHPARSAAVSLQPDTYAPLFKIRRPRSLSTVHFLKLELRDPSDALIADNLYWFSRKKATTKDRYAALKQLREPGRQVALTTALETTKEGDHPTLRATLKNDTPGIAFFTHLKLLRQDGQTRVLPTFFSDNDFTLFPGEQTAISINYTQETAGAESPRLFVEGWNTIPAEIR